METSKNTGGVLGSSHLLEIKGIKKTFGNFTVSLDFNVDGGDTLALVGPSGSGKTTALNLIAGLTAPESGKVILDGEDITELPPWKRNISVVFQDLALFPHLDTGGNIAYGLFLKKIPKKERNRIVEETLELVRLPGYASRRIDTLSGGERQRVAIARSLASKPRAMLLDEPFSSLDAPLRKNLRREFLRIREDSKVPCIFVTHDREEAMMLGDSIALMKEGRIAETGTGRELFLAPKTETAARFFGAGQVLPCRILDKDEGSVKVSSPLGILNIPDSSGTIPAFPMLFVPHDAIFYGGETLPGQSSRELKSISADCAGSFFEGQRLIIKIVLPGEKEIPFEISASPRAMPPVSGSTINLLLDQSLLQLILPSPV